MLQAASFKIPLAFVICLACSISYASLSTYIALQRMYLEEQAKTSRDLAEQQRYYLERNPEALCSTPYAQSRMAYDQCVKASKIYKCEQSPTRSQRPC